MMRDLVLLSNFGLMDYSLLTVVAFNPKYVEANPHKFDGHEKGPITLKPEYQKNDFYAEQNLKLES